MRFFKKTAPPATPAAVTPRAAADLDARNKAALSKMLTPETAVVGAQIDLRNGRIAKLTAIQDGQVKSMEWATHPALNLAAGLLAQLEKDTSFSDMTWNAAMRLLCANCPTMTLHDFWYVLNQTQGYQQDIVASALKNGRPFTRESYPGAPVQPKINLTVKPQISIPPAPAPVVSVIQEKAATPPPRMEISEVVRDSNGFIQKVVKRPG